MPKSFCVRRFAKGKHRVVTKVEDMEKPRLSATFFFQWPEYINCFLLSVSALSNTQHEASRQVGVDSRTTYEVWKIDITSVANMDDLMKFSTEALAGSLTDPAGATKKSHGGSGTDTRQPRFFFFVKSSSHTNCAMVASYFNVFHNIEYILNIVQKIRNNIYIYIAIGSMVLVYMLTWLGYINGIHVTIYSSTMDPSWDMYLYVFVHPVARKSMTSSLDWKFLFLWNTYHISVFSNLVSLDMGDGSKSYYNFHIWGTLWQFNISYWTWP